MDLIKEIWKDLQSLGISGSISTLPEFFSWLRKVQFLHVPLTLKKISNTVFSTPTNSVTLSTLANVMSGSFGTVYIVNRETENSSSTVFLKTSPKYPKSLFLEAILQSSAHSTLKLYGFPNAVPRVVDLFKHPEFGFVFTTERVPGAQLFADYLKHGLQWGIPSVENDKKVLRVIVQVATYLAILESNIGLNHRDLKGTNVLMVTPSDTWKKTVSVGSYKWTLQCDQKVVLIDFGFSCIGRENGQTVVSAGEHLPTIDFCPKKGRDLFYFFATLWSVPAFRASVTPVTVALFRKWLKDKSPTCWADWLITSLQNNLESMLLLTNSDHFSSEPCDPINIIDDIFLIYPDIVRLYKLNSPATPTTSALIL
jgi:serine/threonine protein kinase